MGCFAWKITSNKWPLLFSFQIGDSNEWERGSSLHIQCYLHLNRWRSCLMLASTQEDRRVREFIAENYFFSFSFVGFPMSFKQKRKKCNTCKVVKMSVSFPKESIPFRWRVCMESLGMLIKPLLLSQSPWPLACQICVSSRGRDVSAAWTPCQETTFSSGLLSHDRKFCCFPGFQLDEKANTLLK